MKMGTVGERVREFRKSEKLSQEKLGARIGIKKAAVSAMELETQGVTERNIALFHKEFGVSEAWLRDGTGEMYAADAERDAEYLIKKWGIADPFLKDVIAALVKLPPEKIDEAKDWILEITDKYRRPGSEAAERAAALEAEVEAYRQELEAEQKGGTSPASEKRGTA
ncbi:MAG: helix-turn-helix domain-containing protein [Clostridiales Family XIII bacterium]|jgi:transcriptional regulator with XRE-family HTH domain|nr:helix-turn-helix domain-containing protein [Clostridiales Family XIII bacterium]